MDVLERLHCAGIVPVVVIEDAKDAVPAARALLAGGVDVMEITFRTAAAKDAIAAVAAECPEMLVGAGTVLSADQCRSALGAGAKFIVSPGYSEEVVDLCLEQGTAVTPGCVTPTEIMTALSHGLKVLKFFPAGIYGGLAAMKALAAPFGGIRFIPTGGVSAANLAEYCSAPFVHAVGGSWICAKADIASHQFDKITKLTAEARKISLGFELAHIGINAADEKTADELSEQFASVFGFENRIGTASNFAGSAFEIMKANGLGEKGHIAVWTNSIPRGVAELRRRGFVIEESGARYAGGKLNAVYLKQEFGGFAVHLLQR